MVETGRVIAGRYLLQRLLKQGQACAVYQGTDQVLQRSVAVKVVPAAHVQVYRAAMRMTSQFSHPNIVGIYDLLVEPETLYVVQEYVDGDDFGTLLQTQLAPYYVADMGLQICQALLYATSASRKVCHGDLTPSAVMRDRRGQARISNFALPSDLYYFTDWSVIGGDGIIVSDRDLPWGQPSDGRRADDTRAVGLLLYQLLAGRPPGATTVDPPTDGRLRFLRNVPAELCEVIARTVVRQHPQYINTVETLFTELRTIVDLLEPPSVATTDDSHQVEDVARIQQFSPTISGPGKLATALPLRETGQAGAGLLRSDTNTRMPSINLPPAAPTVADVPLKLATARQAAYPEREAQPRRIALPVLLALGLLVFALFFMIGYFVAHTFVH